jgi:curved DNA-binding protein CbpA
LNRGIDILSLPLNTKEGFVLSRIDGISSVEDIAMMVGVKVTELLTTLDRLADLGAVKLAWRANVPVAKPAPGKDLPPKAASDQPASAAKGMDHPAVQRALAAPGVQLFTEVEVAEPGDLSEVQKRRVLGAFYGLEGKNYYQMLGLDPSADKKAVRAAYFELSRLFHPDSLFGKNLGPFKAKMESVFKRLTEAYEVLSRGQRRKEYDEYLAGTASTHAVQPGQDKLDKLESQARARSVPVAAAPAPTPRTTSPTPPTSAPSTPSAAARSTAKPARGDATDPRQSQVQVRSVSPEERRAQARERLRRSFVGPTEASSVATRATEPPRTTSATGATSATAGERRDSALKGLKDSLRQNSGVDGVLAHLRRAREAEQRGDMVAAVAALQAALVLQPNHKDIQAQYDRVSRNVARELADNYQKQALYEERQSKWSAAATSWERVLEGRPEDATAARAAANALLRASGDLAKARQLAQRAVDAAPRDCANVVVLARVLLASGQRINARRELEKAVKLDPQNEMIKNLLLEAR